MKYSSKRELIADIEKEHATFLEVAATIPQRQYTTAGVWGDDWNVKDLFLHLTEWEQMFLTWYRAGVCGEDVEVPAPGYKWSDTPRMNRDIQRRRKRTSWKRTKDEFDASYAEILEVAKGIPPRKLFDAGHYPWTKKNALVSYLNANSAGHYRTATKILKRWKRQQKESS